MNRETFVVLFAAGAGMIAVVSACWVGGWR